ncbi:hypothetical protein ACFQU7_33180 [Pseudoroseomonas wenyumeiae]
MIAGRIGQDDRTSSKAIQRRGTNMAMNRRAFTASLMMGAASAVVPEAKAQGIPAPRQARNVVLVHGLFADGSSWLEVIPLLQARGLNVTAVQNP